MPLSRGMAPGIVRAGAAADPGTLNLGHAINASVAFAIGSHPVGSTHLSKEMISGNPFTLMGTSAFDGAHPDQPTWRGLHVRNTASDGAYIAETAGWDGINTVWSIWADVTVQNTLAAWAGLISQPAGTGAWGTGDLYQRLGYFQQDSTQLANVTYRINTPANRNYAGAAGSFPSGTGRRRYCVVKNGATLQFYVNGAQVGTDITVDATALVANDLDITIGNRSRYSAAPPGEHFNAIYHGLRAWTRALSGAEVGSLNSNPLLGVNGA